MKLNIYDKKKIIKTYEVEAYDVKFGTLEDVTKAIDLDGLKTGSNVEIIKMAGKLILTNIETFKALFKDIFDGITDEELKKASLKEMATVIVDIVKYTISELNFGNNEKN